MKTFLKVSALLITALFLSHCSEDQTIQPQEPFEDLTTSASAYADQFLTFSITTTATDRSFDFDIDGRGGKIAVNWGDGTIEKRTLIAGNGWFQHAYNSAKNYTVTVSGDIKTIWALQIWHEEVTVRNIHLGGLTNLEILAFEDFINGPQIMNLSQNRLLEFLELEGINNLTDVVMPPTNRIDYSTVRLNVPTQVVDRIIARIYDSVVNSPRQGTLNLRASTNENGNSMIGPPSSYSINKLRKLRDTYGWYIVPSIY